MATIGHGVDILKHARIRKILASKYCDRFVRRILHPQYELPRYQQMVDQTSNSSGAGSTQHSSDTDPSVAHSSTGAASRLLDKKCRLLSSTFSAKEALFKSLDAEDQRVFTFKDWYRVSTPGLASSRVLVNSKYSKADQERFIWSISHDGEYTIASVIRTQKLWLK